MPMQLDVPLFTPSWLFVKPRRPPFSSFDKASLASHNCSQM